jgi:membrane protein DedA with SNARE-associated domain
VAVAAGTAEDADEELELRVPLGIVAFLSLPAMMLWVLAGVLIAAGQVLNVAVLGAVATSVLAIRLGRTGATVDLDGI